ncbi:1,4-beta-xylanase [Rhodophyticola sp. CCM32]|uniref:1,4-beta-xylanase n=1 Tax=Rhodophyticola sp. CCM32 TaxID=2916397 RepID=UPI00107F5BF9|nr:1,4-beta-xylanase [Rhodophyticola sp. CCM32]QBY00802.1 1,4-beta-xylanase [Rhodophyticola sp. CCM32]
MTDDETLNPRWDADKAWQWKASHPWIVGCNFLPGYAVNFVDMWHKETYDPLAINRELGWAASVGMNAVRVNLQYLQWVDDIAGQTRIFESFLEIASRNNIMVVPCLFDDCGFSGDPANADLQPDPRPGVHNGRALASPGREIVMDRSQWSFCLDFLQDVIGKFKDDPRILFWDIYNEPGNGAIFLNAATTRDVRAELEPNSLDFLKQAFDAAVHVNPIHPLTSGAWRHGDFDNVTVPDDIPYQNAIDQAMLQMSDIISFHGYVTVERMEVLIAYLNKFGRPLFCTEWMARPMGSRIQDQLPVLRQHEVGAFQWGLVKGRSQTHIPWPKVIADHPQASGEASEWFHDLLHPEGMPYDPSEIKTIRTAAGFTT